MPTPGLFGGTVDRLQSKKALGSNENLETSDHGAVGPFVTKSTYIYRVLSAANIV